MAWREAENIGLLKASFDVAWVQGRDNLDLGCAKGFLASAVAKAEARSVFGIDANAWAIAVASERVAALPEAQRPEFRVAQDVRGIEVPDASFDPICCFDVMQHLSLYEAINCDWHRVLRPGGRVWIAWTPYRHPYGHHLSEWAPLPWGHLILGQRRMFRVCERILDEPAYRPPYFDIGPDGQRRNRFRGQHSFDDYLNDLTTGEFERIARDAGLEIRRRHLKPLVADSAAGVVTGAGCPG